MLEGEDDRTLGVVRVFVRVLKLLVLVRREIRQEKRKEREMRGDGLGVEWYLVVCSRLSKSFGGRRLMRK